MTRSRLPDEIIERLQMLAAVHDQAATLVREIVAQFEADGAVKPDGFVAPSPEETCPIGPVSGRNDCPIVDRDTLSIRWRGRTCCLGNTLAFWFFERLSRRPGQLVSHQQLLDEVWDGVRSKEAIRSVAKVLRQKLRQAGMEELATAVDGSSRDHYGLKLPGRS